MHSERHAGDAPGALHTAPHVSAGLAVGNERPGAARPNGVRTTGFLLGGTVLAVGALITGCREETAPVVSGSGVAGVVRLGPRCPVEVRGRPCPDVPPVGVEVLIAQQLPGERYGAGDPVAQTATDGKGRFRVAVPPGAYVVTAEAGMSCEFMDVVVTAGAFTNIDVSCDTGIR